MDIPSFFSRTFIELFIKFILYLFSILDTCGEGEYKCENSGICIGIDKICDGTVDCPDNEEDEWTCLEEPSKCLGPEKVCDGIKDCDNNEDEEECCKHSKLNHRRLKLVLYG